MQRPRRREILGGPAGRFGVLDHNGPVLAPAGDEGLPDFEPLAWFRTEVARNGTPEGVQVDSPAIAGGLYGRGRVVVISPHPEQTRGLAGLVERALAWAAGRSAGSPTPVR
jgi:hypothetical protein